MLHSARNSSVYRTPKYSSPRPALPIQTPIMYRLRQILDLRCWPVHCSSPGWLSPTGQWYQAVVRFRKSPWIWSKWYSNRVCLIQTWTVTGWHLLVPRRCQSDSDAQKMGFPRDFKAGYCIEIRGLKEIYSQSGSFPQITKQVFLPISE